MNKPIQQQLKLFFLIILFNISCGLLHAQSPLVKQWDKRFGGIDEDYPYSLQQTNHGGYLIAGHSQSGISGDKTQPSWGSYDYWIVKIDSIGSMQWDKRFGGTNGEGLHALKQTTDGGYVLGGYSNSNISGDKTQSSWSNSFDYWIVKIDSIGNKQWDTRFGGTDDEKLYSLQQTNDGGYIIAGYSQSGISGDRTQPSWGDYDYWIVKLDSLGNKIWDKRYGGTSFEALFAVELTSDNGYILGGTSSSDSSGDKTQSSWAGSLDYWIVKIDSLGNKQWDKTLGGTNDDYLFSLKNTKDGGYIVGGTSLSNISGDKTHPNWDVTGSSRDYWIIKIDSSGNKLWDRDYGGLGDEENFGNVMQTIDDGYIVYGTSNSNIGGDKTENNLGVEQQWLIKIDSLGNKTWDKTILTNSGSNHDEIGYAIPTTMGCYITVVGTFAGIGGDKSQPNWDITNNTSDFWIIKFCDTTQINLAPSIKLSSTDTNFCEKQCIDFTDLSTNNPTSWQWFFPGADSTTSTLQNPTNICYSTYGSFDITLIACNAAGCDTLILPGFINEYPLPTATITQSNDTLFSSSGVSYQWWSVDSGIITGANNYYYVPTYAGNYYVNVTDTIGCVSASNVISITGINELSMRNLKLVITPNPNNGSFALSFSSSNISKGRIEIYNAFGQMVYNNSIEISEGRNVINLDLKNYESGIYFVNLKTYSGVLREKLVKE